MLQFLRPGDVILHSEPVYDGTDYLLKQILPRFGIRPVGVQAGWGIDVFEKLLLDPAIRNHLAMIFIETLANPTNALVVIVGWAALARRHAFAQATDKGAVFDACYTIRVRTSQKGPESCLGVAAG